MFDNITTSKANKMFEKGEKMKTLKELRENKKLTQEQASNKLNITKEYLSMIERAERNPSDSLKEQMSELYGTSIGNIFLAIKQTKCLK
jgi:transcriptional regulator with XRE-family HTH domain